MNKRRLILLLEEYPYGFGEYPFIKTELKLLREFFDISIFCSSKRERMSMEVDDGIMVYHYIPSFSFTDKLYALTSMMCSSLGRSEIKDIFKSGKNLMGRIYESVSFYGSALQVRKYAENNILKDKDEDIIIYSYWFDPNCLSFLMARKKYPKMKVISRIHGHDLYNERCMFGRQPFRSLMDQLIDRLVFIGEKGREYYLKDLGLADDNEKYRLRYLGTEAPIIRNNEEEHDDSFLLVSCSDCIPLKRIHLIIDALSSIDSRDLKEKTVQWIHFGGGSLLEDLRKHASEKLDHSEAVRYEMKGFVPLEDIFRFYAQNRPHGFITTSETEGCPVSVQEAFAYSIPVIGTSVGEIPLMIRDNGYLLDADPSVEEIKEAIVHLYNDSFDDKKMSLLRQKAFGMWKEKFDAVQNAEIFVNELKEL